ncbi:MAG: phenylacetic acid degradation protein PaaY [Betaproteobacteria bacterium]|nr:phenylacetic acid degradation protein PaaY [Betaproteobacteria bacterium]
MPCYSLDGLSPVVHPSAFVHPSAELIGDVWVGANCYIGPLASLRGDFGRIVVREGANVQDTCVLHAFPGRDCVVEVDGHIGHGAVLHGCTVGRNALVGMNSVVMDEVEIGESTIVAAGAFVRAGLKAPARVLLVGTPAKVVRELSDDEVKWKSEGTGVYQSLARRCRSSLVPVQPLTQDDENRRRYTSAELHAGCTDSQGGLEPLVALKRASS